MPSDWHPSHTLPVQQDTLSDLDLETLELVIALAHLILTYRDRSVICQQLWCLSCLLALSSLPVSHSYLIRSKGHSSEL